MNELKQLWSTLLGRTPNDQQFILWSVKHTADIVRKAILKTGQKNLMMGGTMSDDHRVRFASKVMITLTAQKVEHAANRERLNSEFAAKAGGHQ